MRALVSVSARGLACLSLLHHWHGHLFQFGECCLGLILTWALGQTTWMTMMLYPPSSLMCLIPWPLSEEWYVASTLPRNHSTVNKYLHLHGSSTLHICTPRWNLLSNIYPLHNWKWILSWFQIWSPSRHLYNVLRNTSCKEWSQNRIPHQFLLWVHLIKSILKMFICNCTHGTFPHFLIQNNKDIWLNYSTHLIFTTFKILLTILYNTSKHVFWSDGFLIFDFEPEYL